MRGRRRGVHGGRALPAAAHRILGSVPGSGRARGLPPRPLPPRPAPLLRSRAARAHPRAALLPVRGPRVRGAPAPDLRARLRLLGARPRAALLPRAPRRLRAQSGLQAPPSLPTTWTTRARAWHPGATAEPAETGVRSAKPSGGFLQGTAAWIVLYRPLSAGGPQSCRTSSTPSRTLGTASYRCPLQMSPRRGAPCSSCSLSWLSSPCSDCDSRPRTIQTAAPPCLVLGHVHGLLLH
ncbi:GDNF family receptor alpha-4 isoform X6 [Equus asinus]|uniref:GDNF family receptor alpha-4 isoform X6 n=1 Tax=Equus asinus TaxID=9793 RepID=UPI0038F78AA1